MKHIEIVILCLLLGPVVYGQNGLAKGVRRGVFPAVEVAHVPNILSTTALNRQAFANSGRLTRKMVSYAMQKNTARQMRPLLFQSQKWKAEDLSVKLEYNQKVGNFNLLTPQQAARAVGQYRQAMEAVQTLSAYIDSQIYYLGTSEAEPLNPQQIRGILEDIFQAQRVVSAARASWGDEEKLEQAARYLANAKGFYTMLATGNYFEVNTKPLAPIERTDGHTYIAEEFDLAKMANFSFKIPRRRPWNFGSGNHNPRGVLPKGLRVAVFQDTQMIISNLKTMQELAELEDWQMDYYNDPEYFLNQGFYKQQYDLILTDIQMPNGGGKYLARQLRHRGYEGSILALSLFDSERAFFDDGIDGMITVLGSPDDIWNCLNNYFILKEKYGWKH